MTSSSYRDLIPCSKSARASCRMSFSPSADRKNPPRRNEEGCWSLLLLREACLGSKHDKVLEGPIGKHCAPNDGTRRNSAEGTRDETHRAVVYQQEHLPLGNWSWREIRHNVPMQIGFIGCLTIHIYLAVLCLHGFARKANDTLDIWITGGNAGWPEYNDVTPPRLV